MNRRIAALICAVVLLFAPGSALGVAIDDYQAAVNDGPWYEPLDEQSNCSDLTSGGAIGGSVTLTGKDNEEKIWNYLKGQGFNDVQAAGIIGNLVAESSLNPAADQPNGPGRGIAQWSEGGRWDTDANDNLKWFIQTKVLKNTAPTTEQMNDLGNQLQFLMYEITQVGTWKPANTSTRAATTVLAATRAWMLDFEKPADQSEAHINSRYTNFSKPVYDRHSTGGSPTATATNPTSSAACGTGATSGIVAGNMIATAKALAWPNDNCTQTYNGETRDNCKDPLEAYRSVIVHPNGIDVFTDCGTFVATVMRKSGIDPNYPVVGTQVQKAYVQGLAGEKYQIITNPSSEDQLQDADILISSSHTLIYIGKSGGGKTRIDASLHDHSPEIGTGSLSWMLQDSSTIVVRVIK